MAASSIRFGPGSTKEVGMDFKNMGAKRVCIVTDTNVAQLDAMKQATEGLAREGVEFTVFDKVRTEPKDSSYVFQLWVDKYGDSWMYTGSRKPLLLLSHITLTHS